MRKLLLILSLLAAGTAVAAEPALPASRDSLSDTDDNLARAAEKGWYFSVGAGFNVGGTSPLPLPREIREIKSYDPRLNISVGGTIHKHFGRSPWGVALNLRLETKGMQTRARVKNYHMEAVNTDGSGTVVGAWTGNVKTRVSNTYLTLAPLATFDLGSRWQLSAGPYFSYLTSGEFTGEAYDGYIRDQDPTGNKSQVSCATYDFSDNLRRFHWGAQIGGEYRAYRHLAIKANLQWGFNGIFHSDFHSVTFSLYPIYAHIGFDYLF